MTAPESFRSENRRLAASARALLRSQPQPNVLADEAQPNRLSSELVGPALTMPRRNPAPTGVVARSGGGEPVDPRFERPARRAPSLSRILFLGFLIITAFRLVGALVGHR